MANVSLLGALGGLEGSGLSFRNRLINGGFDIWQRGTSFASVADGTYVADRWLVGFNGTGSARTVSRQDFSAGQTDVPGNPKYFVKWNQTVPGTGGSFNFIMQRIEDVASLSGRTVTLSFWAKAASSTSVSLSFDQNFGTGGSAFNPQSGGSVTIGTTWQRYSVTYTFQSVSGKTIGANNFCAIAFLFPNNATSDVDIANVQLEEGVAPTPFEIRPTGLELSLCQRYCQKFGPGSLYTSFGVIPGTGNNTPYARINLKQTMRVTPSTVSTTGLFQASIDTAVINVTISGIDAGASKDVAVLSLNAASATTAGFCYILIAANDATASITLAAEL